jgi:hypothetical protein
MSPADWSRNKQTKKKPIARALAAPDRGACHCQAQTGAGETQRRIQAGIQ